MVGCAAAPARGAQRRPGCRRAGTSPAPRAAGACAAPRRGGTAIRANSSTVQAGPSYPSSSRTQLLTSSGRPSRASVRCGCEATAVELAAGPGRRGAGTGGQPVRARCGRARPVQPGPQHPRAGRVREGAAAGEPAARTDVRRRPARASRSTRSSRCRSATDGHERQRQVPLLGQRSSGSSAASRRTERGTRRDARAPRPAARRRRTASWGDASRRRETGPESSMFRTPSGHDAECGDHAALCLDRSNNSPARARERTSPRGDLARTALPPRRDVRRQRHQLRAVQRGRRPGRAVPLRRRRRRDPRRADRGRRLRLALLPADRAAGPALRLPRARPVGPRARACAATPTSCCSTPTPRRPAATSTGTSRCSATTSATRTRATTTTPRRTCRRAS